MAMVRVRGDRRSWGNVERMVGMERSRQEEYDELGKRWKEYLYLSLPCSPESFPEQAKQELLRLIVDVQQNRNRPEGLS
jgi:hypothetical protein